MDKGNVIEPKVFKRLLVEVVVRWMLLLPVTFTTPFILAVIPQMPFAILPGIIVVAMWGWSFQGVQQTFLAHGLALIKLYPDKLEYYDLCGKHFIFWNQVKDVRIRQVAGQVFLTFELSDGKRNDVIITNHSVFVSVEEIYETVMHYVAMQGE